MQFTVFQSCEYGSLRPKRTMLGFNAEVFLTINKMCTGVTPSHRHEKWGISETTQTIATAMEAAYPLKLARLMALQFVLALQRRGIKMPPETLNEISQGDTTNLPALRAQTGVQSKASRLPPLIPTYAAKVAITAFRTDLPQVDVGYKASTDMQVDAYNAPTVLPKGAKLLHTMSALLPPNVCSGGRLSLVSSGNKMKLTELQPCATTPRPLTPRRV